MDESTYQLTRRIDLLEREVRLLRRGGCICNQPAFHPAIMRGAYRCGNCDATVSTQVLPPELRPNQEE